ncbi:MAG: hypothetical protein ACQGVK_13980 [Myxococcota bacterium]
MDSQANTPAPSGTGLLRALRIPVGLVWLLGAAAFFLPGDAGMLPALRLAFVALAAVHALECLIFLPALRASGRPLAGQLVQVMLFGVVHYGLLQAEQAEQAARSAREAGTSEAG